METKATESIKSKRAVGRPRTRSYEELLETAKAFIRAQRDFDLEHTQAAFCQHTSVHVRQLRRALSAENSTWAALIEEVRRESDSSTSSFQGAETIRKPCTQDLESALAQLLRGGTSFDSISRFQRQIDALLESRDDVPGKESEFISIVDRVAKARFPDYLSNEGANQRLDTVAIIAQRAYQRYRTNRRKQS